MLYGNYVVTKQVGKGTYHRRSDFEKLVGGQGVDWNMNIKDLKKRLHNFNDVF